MSADFIVALLAAKADVNAESPTGAPIHWACGGAHAETAKALLAHAADPNARDRDTITPLILATATRSADIVEVGEQEQEQEEEEEEEVEGGGEQEEENETEEEEEDVLAAM